MGMQFRELADWVRRRKFFAGVLVIFTLAIGILIGTLISGRAMATRGQAGNGASLLAIPDPVSLSGTFSAIAGKLEPTVVNISTTQVIDRPKGKQKRKPGDPFDDFFDRFFDNQDEGPAAERSLGSGVVVDGKGYILTNNHVVDQATKIEVTIDKDPSALHGQGDRHRYAHRPGGDQDRFRPRAADREAGEFEWSAGGRLGVGDWEPVWIAGYRDCGNRAAPRIGRIRDFNFRNSFRRMRRLIPEIPAARW